MTRINCAIRPSELSNKHLLAEHREIKRIPNCIKSGRYNLKDIPENFTLGKGHVKFFYNKLLYLQKRYLDIYQECINRGFNITSYHDAFNALPSHLNNNYTETERDRHILLERLLERDFDYYKHLLKI